MQTNYPIPKTRSSTELNRKSQRTTNARETVRKVGFYFTVALTFIRCTQIHELITYHLNRNSYLLYIVGVPAVLGLIVSNSIVRPFRFSQAYYWLGFSLWMVLTIPFAYWKSGSLHVVEEYWRINVMLIFLLGGLIISWKEFELLLRVLAVSCIFNLISINVYGQLDARGRMFLPFGTLANSNDYAAHILMLLPAILWVALTMKSIALRIVALGIVGYALFALLSSGSRGALISVSVGILYFLASASQNRRLWAVGITVAMLFAVFSLVSPRAVQRMVSFSKSSSAPDEASESADIRMRLLKDAVSYALRYPLFGLGPENFREVERLTAKTMSEPVHNSYLQVACEAGLPALFLFLGGVTTSWFTFLRIKRTLQRDLLAKDLTQAALCLQLMMVMFCIAAGFLNFAYAFHFPLMVGISIAMANASKNWKFNLNRRRKLRNLQGWEKSKRRTEGVWTECI
jgi:O-antigen ligase